MKSLRALLGLLLLMVVAAGCSSTRTVRVPVAPRMDLARYHTIGLVRFTSNGGGNAQLEDESTQRFLAAVQDAQPGTRVVELGSEEEVLASVHRKSWGTATLRAIKDQHGVEAVITGRLDLTRAKPNVSIASGSWKSVNVRAEVNATLSARMVETDTGATVWTDSGRRTEEVANAGFSSGGGGHVGVGDRESAYQNMIDCLATEITDDFRTHYVLRRVPKDQVVETASAGE